MASLSDARMHAREAENRAIAIAFLASVALHLLLLVAWPALRASSPRTGFSPGPLIARLLAPEPVSPDEVALSQARKPDEPKPEAVSAQALGHAPGAAVSPVHVPPPAVPAKREPSRSLAEEPQPAPQREESVIDTGSGKRAVLPPRELPSVSEPARITSGQEAAASARAPGSIEGAPRDALAPSARSSASTRRAEVLALDAPDPGALAQYRLAVIDAAWRYKRYPRVALDNNWEGRVEVRMMIGASGAIASLEVRASAGHDVLDQEALDIIRRAKPQTPIPAALRGRKFAIEIPVIFSLRESGA